MAPTKLQKGDKPKKKTREQKETEQVADPLREAISALGGDDEDYALLKAVDDNREMVTSGSHADEAKLARDVANFIQSLQIPKEQSEWLVDDEGISASERTDSEGNEGTNDVPLVASEAAPVKGKAPKYLFPPTPHWYSALSPLPSSTCQTPSESTISSLSSRAEALLKQNVEHYSHTDSSSDTKFLSRILTSGTLSDQLSALTLMVQTSPLHNQKALESLRSMAGKKSRSESLKALRAIVDWWVGGGSPDRKLKYFRDQPLNHLEKKDVHLVVWYFEDWLKRFFFSLLQTLEALTVDPLPYVRTQAIALVSGLLISKPEQEHNVLRLLVNKLGDSERSVASKASYHLLAVLQAHPHMKGIIVREAEALILKAPTSTTSAAGNPTTSHKSSQPTTSWNTHARYFAVVTFNQIVLTKADKEVASKLIDVYFELFKGIIGEGREANGAVVVEGGQDNGETMAKGREGRRARAKESLNYTKATGKGKETEKSNHEFVEAQSSDSKIISAILTGVNRALPFAGVANETLDKRIDTLFRISHSATFNVSIQALVLMQQVSTSRPVVQPRYYRALYATLLDSRLASSSKQAMFLNLLFKSLKVDQDLIRVRAFVKRFLQVLSSGVGCGGDPSFICGGLFLLGELFTTTPGLRDAVSQPERSLGGTPGEYDPRKREPEYCNAAGTCLWELIPLLSHYHPSVSLHARQLLEGGQITATADLGLNTLSHFLDLFVYKNPKKPKPRGTSAMQPAADLGNDTRTTVRLIKGIGAASEQHTTSGTLNNEAFWRKKVEEVPANQLFFHKFFMRKMERTQAIAEKVDKRKADKGAIEEGDMEVSEAIPAKSKGEGDEGDETSSEDEELDEDEVWKAMKSSMPQVAGPDSDESDSVPEDLDGDSEVPTEENLNEEGDNKEDDSEFGFGEDEDDLVGSDVDAPDGLLRLSSNEEAQEEVEEWGGIDADATITRKKRKAHNQSDGDRRKKRRLRDLPTFASARQYAKLIDEADEENL